MRNLVAAVLLALALIGTASAQGPTMTPAEAVCRHFSYVMESLDSLRRDVDAILLNKSQALDPFVVTMNFQMLTTEATILKLKLDDIRAEDPGFHCFAWGSVG